MKSLKLIENSKASIFLLFLRCPNRCAPSAHAMAAPAMDVKWLAQFILDMRVVSVGFVLLRLLHDAEGQLNGKYAQGL